MGNCQNGADAIAHDGDLSMPPTANDQDRYRYNDFGKKSLVSADNLK
jgi:hypothetical protein